MPLQFARAANQRGNVIADHLGNRGLTGRVGRDGLQNGGVEERVGIDPEIFGEVEVGSPVKSHEPPKWKVCNILHGSKRQNGLGLVQQRCELKGRFDAQR